MDSRRDFSRPSSSIALSDGLDAGLLAACDKAEQARENDSEPEDETIEAAADPAFLKQNLDLSNYESEMSNSSGDETNVSPTPTTGAVPVSTTGFQDSA